MNEIWIPVKNYEGCYEISDTGIVRTVARNVTRKNGSVFPVKSKVKVARLSNNGYFTIALVRDNMTKNTTLHRIIAEAFVIKPEGCNVVNHINGIKTDNRIENLEWTTSAENNLHALDNNLRSTRKSMSPAFVKDVMRLRMLGMTNVRIAKHFSSTEGIISGITSGRTYKRLQTELSK